MWGKSLRIKWDPTLNVYSELYNSEGRSCRSSHVGTIKTDRRSPTNLVTHFKTFRDKIKVSFLILRQRIPDLYPDITQLATGGFTIQKVLDPYIRKNLFPSNVLINSISKTLLYWDLILPEISVTVHRNILFSSVSSAGKLPHRL